MLLHKCCIICFLIIFLFLYIYIKKDTFYTIIERYETRPINYQLKSEIGKLLGISPTRIINLKKEGDINLNVLMIDFDILDNNLISNLKHEPSKDEALKIVKNLIINDSFIVKINNIRIRLRKLIPKEHNFIDKEYYFDNEGLKKMNTYIENKYISVPNDKALTNFYTLGFDKNYNLSINI